jgi:hypothetical protein
LKYFDDVVIKASTNASESGRSPLGRRTYEVIETARSHKTGPYAEAMSRILKVVSWARYAGRRDQPLTTSVGVLSGRSSAHLSNTPSLAKTRCIQDLLDTCSIGNHPGMHKRCLRMTMTAPSRNLQAC